MEAMVGLLCLVAPVLLGVGLWAMHQRINGLQDRLFEVELKLKRIEMAPLATQNTVIATPSISPSQPAPIAAPIIETPPSPTPEAPPMAPTDSTPVTSPPPLIESLPMEPLLVPPSLPSTAIAPPRPSAPSPAAPAQPVASPARPLTLPPATTIPLFSPPATSTREARKAAATLAKLPLIDWFLRMHLLVQIGLVVLLIGVALLLRYAVDQGWLSIEIRHLGAAAGGAALGVAGWFAYKKQRGYGLALQGGGLAILYLTTYSAYAIYALLPASVAFGFFAAISAFGIVLALLQDAWLLAYIAMVGAFAAPILAADGGGNYAALLGYYAVVAVTALALAVRKGWQGLALLSLLGVYGVGMLNSVASFTPDDYAGTLAFVAFFFGLFLAASLLLALQPGAGRRVLDLVIAVLNPIAAVGWSALITQHTDKDLGYALAAGGVIYLAVFGVLAWKRWERLAVHRELSLFWGLFLLSISVPIFAEARVTASIWAVAGALWVWLSWRRTAVWLTFWGLLTQAAAGFFFAPTVVDAVLRMWRPATDYRPFLNEFTVGWVILALAGLVSAWLLERMAQRGQRSADSGLLLGLATLTFIWGAAWWFGGGLLEATTVPDLYIASATILFLTLSTVLMDVVGQRLRFALFSAPLWGLLPALAVLALFQVAEISSPLQGGAWLVWPLALAAHVWMLRRHDGVAVVKFYHAGGVWLLAFLAVAATNGLLGLVDAAITLITAATLSVLAAVAGLVTLLAGRLPAPIGPRAALYRLGGAGPVLGAGVAALVLATLTQDGATTPFAYIPVLNPLALASAAVLGVALGWIIVVHKEVAETLRPLVWSLRWVWWGLVVFCLSAELARSLHHLLDLPPTWDGLYGTALFPTLLAVLWSVLALAAMRWGRRIEIGRLWGAGPLVAGSMLAVLLANLTVDGSTAWLPFVPVLNLVALASAVTLGVSLYWLLAVKQEAAEPTRALLWSLRWAWWALLIFCLSAELARSVHHLLGMALTWDGLYNDAIFQALLAVMWSVIALGLMFWGSRRRSRSAWFAGGVVLGLTVAKLFLVDLAGAGTVARIVSFIGVGLLILVIAFVAPAPPREEVVGLGD
jgi:hypothetical protein